MSNYITINNEYRVKWMGDQYALERWVEGGKKTRNPRSGETVTTESKWLPQGQWYTTLTGAVERVIKATASEQAGDLVEFVRIQRELVAELSAMIDVNLSA